MTDATAVLAPGFTAHNIVLPYGSQTRPGASVLAGSSLARGALRTAMAICPPSAGRRPRVVDLGCLEGGYAVEFARAGYEVLGIEARSESIARCNFVADRLGLENLTFAQDDVRNLAAHGRFDIVFCCGLLYHLDYPAAFLKLLGEVTDSLLLLHTHYAENEPNPNYPLSPLAEHEGALGRWWAEAPGGQWSSLEQMEASAWASWRNTASFWPLKRHLLKAMQAGGFPVVYEQFDTLDDIVGDDYIEQNSRSMFVGIKSGAAGRPTVSPAFSAEGETIPADPCAEHAEALSLVERDRPQEALELLRRGARRAIDPELLNDLGVLALRCGDAAEAQDLLRALARLHPEHAAGAANLAALEQIECSTIPAAPPASRPGTWGRDDGPPAAVIDLASPERHRPFVAEIEAAVGGLAGKRVVEVGADHVGSLISAIEMFGGASEVIGLNPAFPSRRVGPRSFMTQVDARACGLDSASVDVVVSSSAFEHVHRLDEVLCEMDRILRPGGLLYSHFGPLWSTSYGHHLWFVHGGREITYHNTLLPPWCHLLHSREEIRAMCEGVVDDVLRDKIVDYVCDSPEQNRLFFDDYQRIVDESPLEVIFLKGYDHYELTPKYPDSRNPVMLEQLATRFPDRHGFLYDGITLMLRKPAQ
jgi:SAM-dependent methyltransferase